MFKHVGMSRWVTAYDHVCHQGERRTIVDEQEAQWRSRANFRDDRVIHSHAAPALRAVDGTGMVVMISWATHAQHLDQTSTASRMAVQANVECDSRLSRPAEIE